MTAKEFYNKVRPYLRDDSKEFEELSWWTKLSFWFKARRVAKRQA